MAPSTHSADVSQIQADTTSIVASQATQTTTLDLLDDYRIHNVGQTASLVTANSTSFVNGLSVAVDLPAGDFFVFAWVSMQVATVGNIGQLELHLNGVNVDYRRFTAVSADDVIPVMLVGGMISDGETALLRVANMSGSGNCTMQKQNMYARAIA